MSNSRLWINQLVKYLIISHDYAQISFVNASREKLADSVWMVNPNSPFMLIHLSGNPQSLNIARKQQIMNEAQSIFNAFRRTGRILDICFDLEGRNFTDELITYIVLYPRCELTEEIAKLFPEINTVIYDVDNAEEEIRHNNEDVRNFLIKKMKVSSNPFRSLTDLKGSLSVTFVICRIICIAVWALINTLANVKNIPPTYIALAFSAYFKPYITGLNQWYRLLTAGFTHVSLFHLLANLIALRPISKAVEEKLGALKTMTILIVSIITGCLFIYFGNSSEISVGLSGGIYGLMSALMVMYYQEGLFRIPAIRQRMLSTIYLNIILNFLPNVSFLGHLGGFVAGVFLGFIFSEKTDRKLKINFTVAWCMLVVFMVGYCVLRHQVSNIYPEIDQRVVQVLQKLNLNDYAETIRKALRKYY
ncbi:MAG: rhomboid family intramembrane serine protease [Erysipelotrichaceae bacterium]|nr:rhomboid family intramembrane serine protease [Erysipelotrichaceae bacterium]